MSTGNFLVQLLQTG